MEPKRARLPAAVVCTPGLEAICRGELEQLGLTPKPAGAGLLEFAATPRQLYAANVWLRTATRVVVRIAMFRATTFAHLQAKADEVDWSPWLADGIAPRFRVRSNDSKLYHTQAVAQRLHQVVGPPSIGEPEQLFVVRIHRNTVTISVDASGDPLHHRPWRTELGTAPLRTTMAAAALLGSGWDGTTNLCDPFCGSGAIPIEAALMAADAPPGGDRPFAFQTWPSFDSGTWASVNGEMTSRRRPVEVHIHASDRDEQMVRAASINAEQAGVADHVKPEGRVVSHLRALPGPGMVVTNPPFGRRVGDGRLDGLYTRFGAVVADRLPDWALTVVCADPALAARTDGRLRKVARFRHGGLKVHLLSRPVPDPADAESTAEESTADDTTEAPADV